MEYGRRPGGAQGNTHIKMGELLRMRKAHGVVVQKGLLTAGPDVTP